MTESALLVPVPEDLTDDGIAPEVMHPCKVKVAQAFHP